MNPDPKGKSAVPSNLSSLIIYNLMSQKLKLLDYAVCFFFLFCGIPEYTNSCTAEDIKT